MANLAANGVDWFINLLNRGGILPANAATLARSISAKQLGDSNFRPRPLTIDNFTDAELDAIYRLSHRSDGTPLSSVTTPTYTPHFPSGTGAAKAHGYDKGGILDYTSPLRVVSTTLGQFGIRDSADPSKATVYDTYDFNRFPVAFLDKGDGAYYRYGQKFNNMDEVKAYLRDQNHRADGAYGRMRVNALRLAHTDADDDASKIKASIRLSDIKKRLGDRLGTYDINRSMGRGDLIRRGIAAGGLTGAAAGAALGLTGGVLSLASKKRRRRWIRSLLCPTLVTAGLTGLAGAAIGGLGSDKLYRHFVRKEAAGDDNPAARKKRRRSMLSRSMDYIIPAAAVGLPLTAALGLGAYGTAKVKGVYDKLVAKYDKADELFPVFYKDMESFYKSRAY